MRIVALLAALALPGAAAASECAREHQAFVLAYKAYNDCSAAGRGAACAPDTQAYDAARASLEQCTSQARTQARPSWENQPRERDEGSYERPDREPPRRSRVLEPSRGPRAR